MNNRYFSLINRAPNLSDFVNWEILEGYSSDKHLIKYFMETM